ncbi:MAG: XrtA/PEP-CTERM system histidine kinase PrsK [Marinomonas sp.]
MNALLPQLMLHIAFIGHIAGAVLCGVAALWMAKSGDPARKDRAAGIIAATATGVWCGLAAALDPLSPPAQSAEIARNLSWIYLLFRLFANDGRDASMRPVRPVIVVLAGVEALHILLVTFLVRFSDYAPVADLVFQIAAILRVLVAIGAMVLLHNLYAGATSSARKLLRWSTIASAGIWVFDLNLYTVSYLSNEAPAILYGLRGAVSAVFVIALAIGANSATLGYQLRPSRAVTFQSLSLLIIGAYLIVMSLVSEALFSLGGEFARLMQTGFLALAILAAVVWLPSQKARSWVRVTAIKHLFQHRYDYRSEWLRFTQTIGRVNSAEDSFEERAVKVLADITESPAGILLAPTEEAELELVARWKWPTLEIPAQAAEYQLTGMLEQSGFIIDLDEVRAGTDHHGEAGFVPDWLVGAHDAWALVPLQHFDRLVGVVVLARPRDSRQLDWEDFDLLKVVGQQLASYLAERSGQQALMEASRFDEFNRRIAFVMHDVKNLASQMALLARNAEKHADKPDFRADMLVTLRNSSDKLNTLLERLGRYGTGQALAMKPVQLNELAKRLIARFKDVHEVTLAHADKSLVMADEEALEQALVHLIQNAVDASENGEPIFIDVSNDGIRGSIQIIDSGSGMAPEFVRNGLFKPFVSSKSGGFGIGAFEARELISGMGGRLDVESREGIGTRFSATMPLAEAAELINRSKGSDAEPEILEEI